MGIRKRGNRWLVWAEAGIDEFGHRHRPSLTVDTYEEAKRAEVKLQHEVYSGRHIKPSHELVPDFCDRYLASRTRLAPATRTRYQSMVDCHIRPPLRRVTLARFTPQVGAKWQEVQLSGGLSPTTVRKHATLLSAAMDLAVAWGLIGKNPMAGVELPPEAAPPFHVYAATEQAALLSAAAASAGDPDSRGHQGRSEGLLYLPVALALATGMRRGELLGLTWQHHDPLAARLHLRRAARRGADHRTEYGPMKTKRSRRVITLPESVNELLVRHHETQRRNRGRHVLLNIDGAPLTIEAFASSWRRVRAKAATILCDDARHLGDPDADHAGDELLAGRFHDLRHTHATELLRDGVPIKVVAERLGDSERVVMTTYAHVLPAMQDAAAAVVETRMRGLLLPL